MILRNYGKLVGQGEWIKNYGRIWYLGITKGSPRYYSSDPHAVEEDYRDRKRKFNDGQYYPTLDSLDRNYDERLRVPKFITRFSSADFHQLPNKRMEISINLMGKIIKVRKSGKSMYFIDLLQDNKVIQIMANNKLMDLSKDDFHMIHNDLRKGDFINCIGFPSVTNTGQLTLKLNRPITLLTPCLNSMKLPEKIVDKKLINANKILNYLIDSNARDKIIIKSKIITLIRNFLNEREFLEVQTPIMSGPSTGANAKPFITRANSLGEVDDNVQETHLQLRVAPELWLKRLVIGGFERIYEIGSNFRNEGIDATHNPEFTSCEFYCTFIALQDLIKISEDLIQYLYHHLSQHYNISHLQDLTLEVKKYEFIPTIEAITGEILPRELTSDNLIAYHNKIGLKLPDIKSPANLLDNLASLIEQKSENSCHPIIIYNHPSVLSPLSKSTTIAYDDRLYDISLRFELFINGKEYINAYEEENSPFEQYEKFKLQQLSKHNFNDDESLIPDWNYIKSLEYGLPPTGGWGCGIDRLAMLFTNSERIEDVLPFGTIKDVLKN